MLYLGQNMIQNVTEGMFNGLIRLNTLDLTGKPKSKPKPKPKPKSKPKPKPNPKPAQA